ncbi:MAG: DUF2203 domain-containing protein [Acidobacteria bacterium]|nr:MAG: DUF2203 domain-containing protein [Acidobacteriota bacterium]
MAAKYFSRLEAEELLPMIGDHLGLALKQKKRIEELDGELARAAAKIMALGGSIPPSGELSENRAQRQEVASQLEEALKQIQQTGCLVKDLDIGLVDFPSLIDGQEVYLCWKLGEERIGYYHGIEEGFAGRKPLDDGEPASGPGRIH